MTLSKSNPWPTKEWLFDWVKSAAEDPGTGIKEFLFINRKTNQKISVETETLTNAWQWLNDIVPDDESKDYMWWCGIQWIAAPEYITDMIITPASQNVRNN